MAKVLSKSERASIERKLELVQKAFPYTEEGCLMFSNYVLNKLVKNGPDLTDSQADIVKYLFNNGTSFKTKKIKRKKLKKLKSKRGNKSSGKKLIKLKYRKIKTGVGSLYRMIQANRGLGKTTLCAIYAVFRIIHDPTTRVLIFSAGGKLSKEIANWIIQIIEGLEILHFMMPDKQNGDRASVEAYDIHWCLRGSEKAPSVKCLGVDSNAAGSRADLLIADDIESMKNSRTVMMRELLIELTKEFESICQQGDIVYLGTPQFFESIYNGLPSRGFDVRIWPARYPNDEQLESYGDKLAPMLRKAVDADPSLKTGYGIDGLQGAPVTPSMFPEKLLVKKEISQGKSKFQLQYMLNTSLSDAERYPLKLNNLIVSDFSGVSGPKLPIWTNDDRERLTFELFSNQPSDRLYRPMQIKGGLESANFERSLMYIDPAGGGKNGDETAYAVIRLIGSYVYIAAWGGVPGGYEEAKLMKLVKVAKDNNVKEIFYEKNFGNGAIAAMLKPLFEKHWPCSLTEHWASGQKELRIIDTIEPLLTSHRLVIHPDVIREDVLSVEKYSSDSRKTYSGLFQMSMITREKDCLVHDDRLDALAGAIYQVVEAIDFSQSIEMDRRKQEEIIKWIEQRKNPHLHRDEYTYEPGDLNNNENVISHDFGGRLKRAA